MINPLSRTLLAALMAIGCAPLYAASVSQASPNGEIVFAVNDDAGTPSYGVYI